MTAVVGPTHVLCAIGRGTEQAWASARAGIARIGSSHVMDRQFEAIQMGLVPEEALESLPPRIEELPLPSRARRLLRLAAPALRAVATGISHPVPLFLGVPEFPAEQPKWLAHLPAYLQIQTAVPIDRAGSVVLAAGRAAAFLALEGALSAIATGATSVAIVGGVDTYLDLRLLAELDAERRILGRTVMDGFIPGEGAAFFVLASPDAAPVSASPRVVVHGAASGMDPGHRYGEAPARGEGLSAALATLRTRTPALPGPIRTTFAGFNGESFEAKLWGVARLRHNDLFTPDMLLEHPADKYGDAGAATGAILMALAVEALASGTRSGPALAWAASDREARGCAVVSVAP